MGLGAVGYGPLRSSCSGGGAAPGAMGGGEKVGEMHYSERKLAVGSIGTEERRSIGTEERRRRGLHVELPAAAAMAPTSGSGRVRLLC